MLIVPVKLMRRIRYYGVVLLFVCLVFSGLFSATLMLPAHAAGILEVLPSSQLAQPKGSTITYTVNVNGMDPFDSWDVSVQTDSSVLTPVSISVANNVVGSVSEVANCVNGSGTGCSGNDAAGVAHSAAASGSGLPYTGGSGLLFTITYSVVGAGYSFVTILTGLDIIAYAGSSVVHSNSGGVYGTPPPLPTASFTFSPMTPVSGDNVTFDASQSHGNNGATVVSYHWRIDSLSGGTIRKANVTYTPVWVHFLTDRLEVGYFSVQLIVVDNNNLQSQPVQQVLNVLVRPLSDLVVNTIRASPQDNIISGTPVSITATILNKGNVQEPGFNLTILLDNKVFKTVNYTGMIDPGHAVSSKFTLDTSGLTPNTYDLVGDIQPSIDPLRKGYLTLRIIDPLLGAFIPFTIPEFAGIIIGILVAVGVVKSLVDRSRTKRRLLEQELS